MINTMVMSQVAYVIKSLSLILDSIKSTAPSSIVVFRELIDQAMNLIQKYKASLMLSIDGSRELSDDDKLLDGATPFARLLFTYVTTTLKTIKESCFSRLVIPNESSVVCFNAINSFIQAILNGLYGSLVNSLPLVWVTRRLDTNWPFYGKLYVVPTTAPEIGETQFVTRAAAEYSIYRHQMEVMRDIQYPYEVSCSKSGCSASFKSDHV